MEDENGLVPVTSLAEEEEGVVYSITGGRGLINRLASMGIVPGIRIKVLRNAGGLVIVLASDTRVALGRGQASHILVARLKGTEEEKGEDKERQKKTLLVALAGPPNVGKSTVFNVLTGLSQHVGNWPGKTVEKKEGIHLTDDCEIRIVDLPGTYSLSAFSEEERVARDFIIHQHPDVIVLIANAAALERSLYLLSELLILGPPVVVAVNMLDIAEAQGIQIDIEALQRLLNLPVVPMVATRNKGIKELLSTIIEVSKRETPFEPKIPGVTEDHKEIFDRLTELVKEYVPPPHPVVWTVIKLMEGDHEVSEEMKGLIPEGVWNDVQNLLLKHEDALRSVVGGRYDWIEEITRSSVQRFKRGEVLTTDRIDHVLTNPLLGIPILLGILALIFVLTFKIGFPLQRWLESLMGMASGAVDIYLQQAPLWLNGLIIDGIIGGVGSVITFIPILIIFFASMALLEDIGYMARAAFVMDRFMHIIGLHGKSFLPMCLGFGCNVPAVFGARIVEAKKARLLTILLSPFVPCTARLSVMTFISAAIFGEKGLLVSWAIVTLNIVVLGATGFIINRLFLRAEPVPFIMELPLYHRPYIRTIAIAVLTRVMAFIKKAGTIILGFSILIWFLSNMPGGGIEESLLARIGHIMTPFGRPFGFDWRMVVAVLSSIVAKENSIATLAVLYDVGEQGLRQVLPNVMGLASGLSFLVVIMLFVPCVPTLAVMKQEMSDWRWLLLSFVLMLIISLGTGAIVYHIATILL